MPRVPLHLALLTLVGALALTGCQSTKSYFSGARIVAKGNSKQDVQDEVVNAFFDQGFKLASGVGDRMVFEKEGKRNDEWMYGGWGGKHTTQRATVTVELGSAEGTVDVRCQAQIVRDFGGMMGEEKGVLWASGRHRFQDILDAAAKELKRMAREKKESRAGAQ